MGSPFSILLKKNLVFGKDKKIFTITPQSPRKYCYFGAFKIFLSKIVTGDPQLLFHILKVKCLRLYAKNNMNFYQAVFPEQNFLENIHK